MPAKRCEKCGRFFTPELSCENIQKYCSPKCANKKHSEAYRSNPINRIKITQTCRLYRRKNPEVIKKARKKYLKSEKYKKYYEKTRPKRRKYLRGYMRGYMKEYNKKKREKPKNF